MAPTRRPINVYGLRIPIPPALFGGVNTLSVGKTVDDVIVDVVVVVGIEGVQ